MGSTPSIVTVVMPLAEKSTWTPEHVDVRDDRVTLYGDVGKDVGTFVYRVRATNAAACGRGACPGAKSATSIETV